MNLFCNNNNLDQELAENAGADMNLFCNNNNLDQELAENVTADDNVPAVKFVGFFLDPALNFKHHISMLKNKLSRSLYSMP